MAGSSPAVLLSVLPGILFGLRGETAPLHGQEPVGGNAERTVMVESAPATPFEMAEAQFLLQFFVIPLNDPTVFGGPHQILELRLRWQVGNPVLRRFGLPLRPLDQQPLFRMRFCLPVVSVGWTDPESGEAGAEGVLFAFAPGEVLPRGNSESER